MDVRIGELELGEERCAQVGVVVLAGVYDVRHEPSITASRYDGCQLDGLGSSAEDKRYGLHETAGGSPGRGLRSESREDWSTVDADKHPILTRSELREHLEAPSSWGED